MTFRDKAEDGRNHAGWARAPYFSHPSGRLHNPVNLAGNQGMSLFVTKMRHFVSKTPWHKTCNLLGES